MSVMDELVNILTLEPIEVNLFLGRSPPGEKGRIFGGQVVALGGEGGFLGAEAIVFGSQSFYLCTQGLGFPGGGGAYGLDFAGGCTKPGIFGSNDLDFLDQAVDAGV